MHKWSEGREVAKNLSVDFSLRQLDLSKQPRWSGSWQIPPLILDLYFISLTPSYHRFRFQIIHREETSTTIKQTSECDEEQNKKFTPSSEDRNDDIIRPTRHCSLSAKDRVILKRTLRRENKSKQIALKLHILKEYIWSC